MIGKLVYELRESKIRNLELEMRINIFKCFAILFLSLTFALTGSGQLSEDLKWATDFVNNAQPRTQQEREQLNLQIIARLRPHASTNNDVRIMVQTMEFQSELLRLESESMAAAANSATSAKSRAERARNLDILRAALIERSAAIMQNIAQPNMSVQDAKRLSEIAKYASQALDDINDPSILGGASTAYTKLLNRLNGVASLEQAVQDPEARSILSGLRGTIGTIDKKLKDLGVSAGNPMKAFDIPAEIAGAMVDNSRQAMDQTSAALQDIAKAIGGDAQALARMSGHSQRIQETLSPKTYGQAMFKAMTDRVVDRIPFVRTLAKLFASPTPKPPAPNTTAKVVELDWWASGNRTDLNENDVYYCGANPTKKGSSFLTGTHRYATISSVCWAAVHTGAINFANGGRFQLRFFPFDENFEARASVLNGVTSDSYNWNSLKKGTFVVIKLN